MTDHSSENERFSVLASAEGVRHNLKQWYHKYTSSEEEIKPILSSCSNADDPFGDGTFRSAYVYKDVPSASVITTYCAYLITLNRTINTLVSNNLHADESFELARTICWSVDFCSRAGYCGTQVMRFSLPIARTTLPVEYHSWIDNWISKFQSAYDASRIQPQRLN